MLVLEPNDQTIFYKLPDNKMPAPEGTKYNCIDRELLVKLFYKGFLLSLPRWFCYSRDCHLNQDCRLENVSVYLQSQTEMLYFVFEVLCKCKLKKIAFFKVHFYPV